MTQETAPGQESEAPPAAPENPFLGEDTPAPQDAAPEDTPAPETPESETPWYHSVESEDDLFGHDNLKSHRETLKADALSEGRLQAQQELRPLLEGSSQEYTKLARQAGSLLGRLNKAASDGTLDENAVDSLLTAHASTFDALREATAAVAPQQRGVTAYNDFLQALAQDMNDFQLAGEFTPRLAFAVAGMDKKFIPDLRKRLIGKAVEEADKKGYERGLAEGRAAKAATQQAQESKNQGPNLAPGTGDSGRISPEVWPTLSTAQRNKARQEGRQPLGAAPER